MLSNAAPRAGRSFFVVRLSIFADHLYFGDDIDGSVMSLRVSGGKPEELVPTDVRVDEVVADASGIYWVESPIGQPGVTVSNSLKRAGPNGENPQTIYSTSSSIIFNTIASNGQLVWQEYTRVMTLPVGGGAARVLEDAGAGSITADQDFVYLSEAKQIIRSSLQPNGGSAVVLPLSDAIRALSSDAESLYWFSGSGLVQSLAK